MIQTIKEYYSALGRIRKLMDAQLNTPEGEELNSLVKQVLRYEKTIWLTSLPEPVE